VIELFQVKADLQAGSAIMGRDAAYRNDAYEKTTLKDKPSFKDLLENERAKQLDRSKKDEKEPQPDKKIEHHEKEVVLKTYSRADESRKVAENADAKAVKADEQAKSSVETDNQAENTAEIEVNLAETKAAGENQAENALVAEVKNGKTANSDEKAKQDAENQSGDGSADKLSADLGGLLTGQADAGQVGALKLADGKGDLANTEALKAETNQQTGAGAVDSAQKAGQNQSLTIAVSDFRTKESEKSALKEQKSAADTADSASKEVKNLADGLKALSDSENLPVNDLQDASSEQKGAFSEGKNASKEAKSVPESTITVRFANAEASLDSANQSNQLNQLVQTVNANGELINQAQSQALSSAHSQAGSAGLYQSDNAGTLLAQQLNGNLGTDIVRHASMVLRDGGTGLIRLNLKPEILGNVKIRLEMADNKVRGHIIVESDAALRAFQQEMKSLVEAFRDNGFAGSNIEFDVRQDNAQQGGRGNEANEKQPYFSERLTAMAASKSYDAGINFSAFPVYNGESRISVYA
jgi:flagellar hook-length control protein FliK